MLVSTANAQLIFVRNANSAEESLGFLNVVDSAGTPVTGLNDAVFPLPGQSLFFLTNPAANLVLLVYIFDVRENQLFALVDSMNALVKVDLRTGIAMPILSDLKGFQRMAVLRIPGEKH